MKVRALVSFVANGPQGEKYRAEVGDELDMPANVDWLRAGLVEAVKPDAKPESPSAKRSPRRTEAPE